MSVQSVQIRLDVGMPHPEAGIRDEFTVFLIVTADILDQVMEFPLLQSGHLAAMQGNIKGYHIRFTEFRDGILQGLQAISASQGIYGVVLQIAVPALHVTCHGRHI